MDHTRPDEKLIKRSRRLPAPNNHSASDAQARRRVRKPKGQPRDLQAGQAEGQRVYVSPAEPAPAEGRRLLRRAYLREMRRQRVLMIAAAWLDLKKRRGPGWPRRNGTP